nr:ventral anterior homeobox 1-like [Maniola hyperantus]
MLHINRLPVKLDSSPGASSVQYEKSREFIIRENFPPEQTIIFDDTSYQYINQNANNIQNWIKGCQVLGFIPDEETSVNFPAQSCCNCSLNYQNQRTYASSPYKYNYSSKPAQNTLKVNLKRKRKRTIFTTEQIVFLEGVFQRKPYITREERVAVMNRVQLTEKAIKIWFRNRRRMTDKKSVEYASDSPSSIDTTDSFSTRLAFIETQIEENTDGNGYVTLNDHVMSELASVIHDYLSKDVSFSDSESLSNSTVTEDLVMYEPISPASDYNIIQIS